MTDSPMLISSADNALVKRIRLLLRDGAAYRKTGQIWVEGDHLCRAAHAKGWQAQTVVWSQTGHERAAKALAEAEWHDLLALAGNAVQTVVLTDKLMRELSGMESPAPVAALFALPEVATATLDQGDHAPVAPNVPTVVLDRVQDPGNMGAIIRTAAALGFKQVLTVKGSVAAWSPKVVRAGMGAHFGLLIREGLDYPALGALAVPILVTSSHQGNWCHEATLPWPCAWVFGHEGQGVGADLQAMAAQHVRIIQPGGEESFNVAAAAAICLHASAAREASKKA
ncbi:MAG: RNA methyltransferase [Burkholderiaceae bacterium]